MIASASFALMPGIRMKSALSPVLTLTALTLQVGDVVEHLDRDYLVEGALLLSESPRAARLCRLIDGSIERFLYGTLIRQDRLFVYRRQKKIWALPTR